MDVCGRITDLRNRYGLSQYALSKKTGLAQAALSQYEAKKKTPSVYTIEQICEGLGISLAAFFQENETEEGSAERIPGLTYDENQLIHNYRVLSNAQQKDLQIVVSCLADRAKSTNQNAE